MIGHHRNDRLRRESQTIDIEAIFGSDLLMHWDARSVTANDGDRVTNWVDQKTAASFNINDPGTLDPLYRSRDFYGLPCFETHTKTSVPAPPDDERNFSQAGMFGTDWPSSGSWALAFAGRFPAPGDSDDDLGLRIDIQGDTSFYIGVEGTGSVNYGDTIVTRVPGGTVGGNWSVTTPRDMNSFAYIVSVDGVAGGGGNTFIMRYKLLTDGGTMGAAMVRSFGGNFYPGNISLYAGDTPLDAHWQCPAVLGFKRYLDQPEQNLVLDYLYEQFRQRPEDLKQ